MLRGNKTRQNRRQKLLVSNSIQWAIVRESLLNWLLYCTAAVFLIGLLQVLVAGSSKPILEHCQAIGQMVLTLLMVFVLLLPKFIYDWFQLSHRFLGPVERVRGVLRDLADGNAHTEIQFRKDDFWREMAEELNSAVRALTGDNSHDRTARAAANEDTIRQTDEKV